MSLSNEIRAAINGCSRENESNTPDFILAEYLMACLVAFESASMRREEWFGQHLSIGGNARQPEEPPANGEQQANHENCHCFIDGAQCVIQETTLRCYGKPCVLNRGKRS